MNLENTLIPPLTFISQSKITLELEKTAKF